jgi:hypothetical protein
MLPIADGLPARAGSVRNVALIGANVAARRVYELPHPDASVQHAGF